jgi:hypothetical protein
MKRKPMPALDPSAFEVAAVPQPDPVDVATRSKHSGVVRRASTAKATSSQQASRMGKVQVQVWVTEDVRRRLKTLALNSDASVEQLLSGAIDQLLRKANI